MASTRTTPSKFVVFLALTALAGCGKDSGGSSVVAPGGAAPAPGESTASALQRTLSDLGNRLAASRRRATTAAVQATATSAICDRSAVAARNLTTSLQEITSYADRLSNLNQRRTAEFEGDALASEGRATSAVEQVSVRVASREEELRRTESALADAERNLLLASSPDTATARARRDAAAAQVAEAHRNLDAERANLVQAQGALGTIAGRREEAARRLLVDATTLDAEMESTEINISKSVSEMETCAR